MTRRPAAAAALLLALVAACAALPSGAGRADRDGPPRAVWVWEEETFRLLDDGAYRAEIVAFLREKGIATVYIYADSYAGRRPIAERPDLYHGLVAALRAAGVEAYALLGSAHLRTEAYVLPEKRTEALEMLDRVLEYQRAAPAEARFAGVNLDIEPHLLRAWRRDREGLMRAFLDVSAAWVARRDEARLDASGLDLPLGPAIPFWLDSFTVEWRGDRRPASDHVQGLYDYVAVMDYRDRAAGTDGMIRHAAAEIAYADEARKRVVVGVDVHPNELDKVTFDEEDEAALERELALVAEAFRAHPSFGGFAIHHLGAYRDWLARGR